MTTKAQSTCLQIPQDNNLELCKSRAKFQLASPTRIQLNPLTLDHKHVMEKKSFKERTVQAWVEAIPKAAGKTEKLSIHQETKSKGGKNYEQFAIDFLENIKKDQNQTVLKSNPYSSKKESSPLWVTDGVQSPSFSPFLTTGKKTVLVLGPQNEFQESHRKKLNHRKL